MIFVPSAIASHYSSITALLPVISFMFSRSGVMECQCCAVLCKGNEMYQIQFLLSLNILRFTIISPFSCNCAGVKTVARPHGEARGRGGQHRRHHPHGDREAPTLQSHNFLGPPRRPRPAPPPRTQGGETRNQFVTRLAAACLSDVGAWSSLTSTRLGRERSHLSRDTTHSVQTPGCPPVLCCHDYPHITARRI